MYKAVYDAGKDDALVDLETLDELLDATRGASES
jgi:hypothetical protein